MELRARGEPRASRRSLILSLRELATGRLTDLVGRDLNNDRLDEGDRREVATDLLFRECARVMQDLGSEALGSEGSDLDAHERLDRVIDLAGSRSFPAPIIEGAIHYQFAGPHHLAVLLRGLIDGMRSAMIVRLPTPSGAQEEQWKNWAIGQAQARPFLWINHQKAVATGYLDRGRSMVMTSPTGSGKTTLSVLKIASTLCANESVVYLAPTHALVDQVETDMDSQIGMLEQVSVVEDLALEELGDRLPPFSVMTPERCLALLGFAPQLFDRVGLLVFDEFHMIGTEDPGKTQKVDARSIDAMLALLTFINRRRKADILLLSAMVANGDEIADWLEGVSELKVASFDDPWKPTRQLRTCVIYDAAEVARSKKAAAKEATVTARRKVPARPLGLFSLISGWHPEKTEKMMVRALSDEQPPLTKNSAGGVTSNRNAVAAQLAIGFAGLGKRVIVFCSDTRACGSIAKAVNGDLTGASDQLDDLQQAMREAVLADVGSAAAAFDATAKRAAEHHGDLLPIERRLTESIFRGRRDIGHPGLDVVAATSTVAQGLNLPCDVVIMAGTDRSTQDDPDGNPRASLSPHEILNAMGRAGRAAYSATGLAVVIPADPILVNPAKLKFNDEESILTTIFSAKDACERVYDPISALLDTIEVSASDDPKIQAMIRRLTSVTDDGDTGFDNIVAKSLGYFQKRRISPIQADIWLARRRNALQVAEEALQDPEVLDWQRELAVRNGVPPEFIERLEGGLSSAPITTAATADWVGWALDIVALKPLELTMFVRADALTTVFGQAYTNSTRPKATARLLIGALKHLVSMWCSGRTLVEIEAWLLKFVRENEGEVGRQATQSSIARRARRFAIKIAPDLGFLCGLVTQVMAKQAELGGTSPLPMADMLTQMVRFGDSDAHQAFIRQQMRAPSRVKSFHRAADLRGYFSSDPGVDIETIREEVRTALLADSFDDLEDDI